MFSVWAAAVTFTKSFSQGLSLTFKDWRKLEERKGVSQSRWDWSVPHWFLWVRSKGTNRLLKHKLLSKILSLTISPNIQVSITWRQNPSSSEEPGRSLNEKRPLTDANTSCIGEGNGNPLQCSCLENPRDGGAWWAAVYGVARSRTRLKWRSSSSSNTDIIQMFKISG